ncbi:UNVERIFIED_CONTAM: hypothetical protein GTU68_054039 [Idotea baltica]|nr:hypothetical protein [Idotea baltica]
MNIVDVEQFESRLRETETSIGIRPDQRVPIIYDRSSDGLGRHLTSAIVVALILILIYRNTSFKINLQSQFPMGRAKFTMIDPLLPGSGRGVKFSDVAGAKEVKQEVMEFVDFLKNPTKYQKLGAKVPAISFSLFRYIYLS